MTKEIIDCPECGEKVSIPGTCDECNTTFGQPIPNECVCGLKDKIEAKIVEFENKNAYWLPQEPDYVRLHFQVDVLKDLLK